MRLVEKIPVGEGRRLRRDDECDARLCSDFATDLEDALSARAPFDRTMSDLLRQYAGVPKNPTRDLPIENAPNMEVTLGAIAADAVYAQFIDLVFNIAPVVTARSTRSDKLGQDDAAALQRRLNHGATTEWGLRPALEEASLDTVQLGTSFLYVPFTETTRKTDLVRVKERGPRIQAWPIEDVIVPGGSTADLEHMRWFALRMWLSRGELMLLAEREGWDVSTFMPTAGHGFVRNARERLGQTKTTNLTERFEVLRVWGYYDYDGDGEDEDLYFIFDRSSRTMGKCRYNPYDSRPGAVARYQLRAYLWYGLGVLEMAQPYQEATSDLVNEYLANVKLSNCNIYFTRTNAVPNNFWIGVNRNIEIADPQNDVREVKPAQPYPSSIQSVQLMVNFAERRIGLGLSEMSASPRPSQVLGGRTPGITALSFLQQVSRRFTPAFDNMRMAAAEALRQCLYREQERLLAGDEEVEQHLLRLLGAEDGARVLRLLRDPLFDTQVTIELTASSASVNREADRQAAILLVNVLATYYERCLTLVQIASNEGVPEPIRNTARQIAEKGGEIIERTIRTFDQVRDPQTFIIDVEKELDAMEQTLPETGLAGLATMLGFGGSATPPPGPATALLPLAANGNGDG